MLTEQERFEKQSQLEVNGRAMDWTISIGMGSFAETVILTSFALHQASGPLLALMLVSAGVLMTSVIRTEILSSRMDKINRVLIEQRMPKNWYLIK